LQFCGEKRSIGLPYFFSVYSSVGNPDSLRQDLAFEVNPDLDPNRIQGFDDQKCKKKNS
jgi:hypothetical protein